MAQSRPLILHGRGLSIGSPGPLDPRELERFAAMTAVADPLWVTVPLGFSRVTGTDLGMSVPIPLNESAVSTLATHARQVMAACGKRLLLKNITGHLQYKSSLPEPEVLNRLCTRAGCGVCLDLTSLYVQSRNQGSDPRRWLAAIEPAHVVQIAVGGCREHDDGWRATHDRSPCTDVLALAEHVCAAAPVQAAILERHADFPPACMLTRDLGRLQRASAELSRAVRT